MSQKPHSWTVRALVSAARTLPHPPSTLTQKRQKSSPEATGISGYISNRSCGAMPWRWHPQPGTTGNVPLGLCFELPSTKAAGTTEGHPRGRKAGCAYGRLTVSNFPSSSISVSSFEKGNRPSQISTAIFKDYFSQIYNLQLCVNCNSNKSNPIFSLTLLLIQS